MGGRAVFLAAAIVLAPPGAKAADLVVWWEAGFYPEEDAAVREIIAAFEQESGTEVELVQPDQYEMNDRARAALATGQPPGFLYGTVVSWWWWAYEGRLVDLEGVLGPTLGLFDADAVEAAMKLNGSTGQRGLYALPMGRRSNHLHVWQSLLKRAGFTPADIPKEWDGFWSFWCDRVQPAVREALGRDDIWGIGLSMSPIVDTENTLEQFQLAYDAPWVDRDRRLQIDDPKIRAGMVKALEDYTLIWRKGCTPPDAIDWDGSGNNRAFLDQRVVMTANGSLSIPGALRTARPDDYYENAAPVDWPAGINGQPLVIDGGLSHAVIFKAGKNPALAGEFVRFWPRKAGSPTGSTSPATGGCRQCASSSSSRSGSTRATRIACTRPSRF